MGRISSPVLSKLDSFEFSAPQTGRLGKAKRVYRCDAKHIVVEMANGTFIAASLSQYQKNGLWLPSSSHIWLIRAFRAFGLITKEEMDAHNEVVRTRELERSRKWDFEQFREIAKKHQIKLTVTQDRLTKPEETTNVHES